MKNFKQRAIYFELENELNAQSNFSDKVQYVKSISDRVSQQLGHDINEAEAYARSHIANIVRENEVSKMLTRIEHDLINNGLNENNDQLIEDATDLLKEIAQKLKGSL